MTRAIADAIKQVYRQSATDHDRPYEMLRILETNPKWCDSEFNHFVECFWDMSNYTSHHWETWSKILVNHYPKARKFTQPKRPWIIYRGGTSPRGFSWTTSLKTAGFFATRNSDPYFSDNCEKSTIWRGIVAPQGVLFTSNGRGEKEVVVKFWEDDIWEIPPLDMVALRKQNIATV